MNYREQIKRAKMLAAELGAKSAMGHQYTKSLADRDEDFLGYRLRFGALYFHPGPHQSSTKSERWNFVKPGKEKLISRRELPLLKMKASQAFREDYPFSSTTMMVVTVYRKGPVSAPKTPEPPVGWEPILSATRGETPLAEVLRGHLSDEEELRYMREEDLVSAAEEVARVSEARLLGRLLLNLRQIHENNKDSAAYRILRCAVQRELNRLQIMTYDTIEETAGLTKL